MSDFMEIPGGTRAAEPATGDDLFRRRLLDRRQRLATAPRAGHRPEIGALLQEVDSALARLDTGEFGICETCDDPIEPERLTGEPLSRVCLACLSDDEQRALERDLELATLIQRALLPDEHVDLGEWEVAHRYLPLGAVSGDYCDVIRPESPGGATHFILGDVSGKGVAASILMSHLQAVFRSLAGSDLPLTDLARRANRILCDGTVSSSYSTLLLGRLSPDGTVELCNAGHCPPLLVRDGEVTPLAATGMPLGVFTESTFGTTRLRLSAGDSLFLYTDGLSEAGDPGGNAYGEARVERVARGMNGQPTGKTLERFLDDVDRFRDGEPLQDDLTVMMVRRAG